jgi:hypothetical protein
MKVLPELLKSVEFGGGGPKALDVVFKIAAGLPSDDFESKVIPVVIRLFGNPDRALRVSLLDGLPLIIDRLSQKIVNDKIFPQLVSVNRKQAPPAEHPVAQELASNQLFIGDWIYRRGACCSRTDAEICAHHRDEVIGPHHQRRTAEVSRQDGQ